MRTRFEHRRHKLATPAEFRWRMAGAVAIWLLLAVGGLALGMAGYAITEGWSLVDSFLNAAMILSGMGPIGTIQTQAGKIFAGFYALFSGLFIVVATSFILAPVLHRVLHAFHVDDAENERD